jgi:hypothetical protein
MGLWKPDFELPARPVAAVRACASGDALILIIMAACYTRQTLAENSPRGAGGSRGVTGALIETRLKAALSPD